MSLDLFERARESAAFLKERGVVGVDTAIVLGSGLSDAVEAISNIIEIPYAGIPYMLPSGAPGHRGVLRYGRLNETNVLVFSGRLHGYEGMPLSDATYPVRIMQALEVQRLVLTAAVGGLRESQKPGDLVLVSDHLNLMPDNPLRGVSDPRLGERFVDLSNVYARDWRETILSKAKADDINLATGVYAGLAGPSLETQAECHMLRSLGADVVGMSVVPEAIVAAQAGIQVLAICVVANMAWHPGDDSGTPVSEILACMGNSAPIVRKLLSLAYQ